MLSRRSAKSSVGCSTDCNGALLGPYGAGTRGSRRRATRSTGWSATGVNVLVAFGYSPYDDHRSAASKQYYPQGHQAGQFDGELRDRPMLVNRFWYRFA